jgi:hypothetical protein
MKNLFALTAIAWAAIMPAVAQTSDKPALLIVGTPHFGNPGRDIVNIRVTDVKTPERQREIEAIVEQLATFRPTHVAVEWAVDKQDRLDKRYAEYRAGRYQLSANETDQIGLRLAARLGLEKVHAVDWLKAPPGADADYDFPAWAAAHGQSEVWGTHVQRQQAEADATTRLMVCTPVSSWLRRANAPQARSEMQRVYYEIARLGDNGANPGANWVGAWYARNLYILNNLTVLARQPQDRVIAIYGAGHGFLLDQQAREASVFEVANTLDYLPRSPRDSWTRCPDSP